jgi:hypothetical protein
MTNDEPQVNEHITILGLCKIVENISILSEQSAHLALIAVETEHEQEGWFLSQQIMEVSSLLSQGTRKISCNVHVFCDGVSQT